MRRGLEQLDALIGEWIAESRKYSEGRGRMTVAPTESGKCLIIDSRQEVGLNQRFIGKITDGGKSIEGQWEFSKDGKSWEVDFDLTYTKTAA